MIKYLKISEFTTVITGGTPSTSNELFWKGGDIPWLNSGELNNSRIYISKNYITQEGLKNSSSKIMLKDSVLIALTGTTTGVTSLLKIEACANQSVTGIMPSNFHVPEYLYYYLTSIRKKILKDAYGGAQKHISQGYVKELQIPLPSLEIQKAIAEKLDKADALRKKDQELLAQYDELAQAIFIDMFGDPVKNEKGWEVILGDKAFKFSSGKFNPTKNLDNNYEYPTYGGNGITGFSKDYLIDYKTIIIGRVGAYCGSVHLSEEKSWITDNAIYIKEFKKKVDLIFAYFFFLNYKLNRFADYSGQPKITQKPLEKMHFWEIPISLQNQFAEKIKNIEAQKAIVKQQAEESENLFQALLQESFNFN